MGGGRREAGGRLKTEETYVYLRLIHADVWQNPTQYFKAIILQLKISGNVKKKSIAITPTPKPKKIQKRYEHVHFETMNTNTIFRKKLFHY